MIYQDRLTERGKCFEYCAKKTDNQSLNEKKSLECIVELYNHEGIFKPREKCLEKHEQQVSDSRTSRVFL